MSSGTGGSHQVIRWPNRSAVLDGSGASALGQTLVPNADRCWPASAESDFSRAELRDDPDAFLWVAKLWTAGRYGRVNVYYGDRVLRWTTTAPVRPFTLVTAPAPPSLICTQSEPS